MTRENKKEKFAISKTALAIFLLGTNFLTQNLAADATSIPSRLLKIVQKAEPQVQETVNAEILSSPYASWGIKTTEQNSSINILPAWRKFQENKEIIVAVVDTGIDPAQPFLKENLFIPKVKEASQSSKEKAELNYGIDFSKGRKSRVQPFDQHGHGTHVSGIIKSVYPQVKLLVLKYYNPQASGQDNLSSTIEALKYAVNANVDIINYSGGGPEPSLEELRVLKEAERRGILVVAAAGNEQSDIDNRSHAYYPASYGLTNIISVTAHDENLRLLNSSNWGKKSVDIAAPGHRIKSSLPHGRAGFLTGTSQATAFVTGSAALIMSQYPELSTMEVKAIIKQSAKKEFLLTNKCSTGGRLDAGKAQYFAEKYLEAKKSRTLANKKDRKVASEPGKIYFRSKYRKAFP